MNRLTILAHRFRVELCLGLLVFFTHAYFYNGVSWNQNARLNAVYAFVDPGTPDTGSLRITRFIEDPRGSNTGDWAVFRGAYYSNKAPGSSLWAIPLYALLRTVERAVHVDPLQLRVEVLNAYALNVWTSVLWTAIASVALYRLVARERDSVAGRRDAIVVALVYAFATLALPFDTQFWGHTTAAACVLLGFASLFRERPRAIIGGVFLGMAVLTEYLAIIGLAVGLAYLLLRRASWRSILGAVLGASVPLAILLVYHRTCFGGFLVTATSMSNPMFVEPKKVGGFFGSLNLDVLFRLLVSKSRGVFVFMPVLLFVPGQILRHLGRPHRGREALACTSVILGSLAVVSCFNGWHGGNATGPRYLIFTLPLWCLMLPRVSAMSMVERWAFSIAALVSAANMFVIASVATMLQQGIESPWKFLYRRFLKGAFPVRSELSHGLSLPDDAHSAPSTFNLGMLGGLHGLASAVPALLGIILGAAVLIWLAGLECRDEAMALPGLRRLLSRRPPPVIVSAARATGSAVSVR